MSYGQRPCSPGTVRLSPVLDMEEPTSHRADGRASRCPRLDSRDVHDEPVVGRTSDSRRAPEVGNLSESVDRRQIHAAAVTTPVANVDRIIGSIRRECLDHVIVFNAAGLRRVVAAYIAYYNDVSYCPTSLCA